MNKEALTPVEQRIVVFYEDELTAVVVNDDGRQVVYVPIRPICDFLGVAWSPQRRRINRDPILSDAMTSVTVTVTESGQRGQMLCLPIDYLNGWLFGINANRVKSEIRKNVLRYQRECYRILADAFLTNSEETAVSPAETTLLQVEQMGLAIAKMAREQIEFDRRLLTTETRVDKASIVVGDLTKRVKTIEKRLATEHTVTDEQASQISQAVKAIALATPEKNFARIYGELYRRFGITSYKLMPANRFAEAMQFLTEWFINLTGDEEIQF